MAKKKTPQADNHGIVDQTPKAGKAPSDFKKKADTHMKVHLRGRSWTIDPESIDDAEVMEMLVDAESGGNIKGIFVVLERLLGKKGKKEAYEVLRDKSTGRVKFSDLNQFFLDLMGAVNPK